jgi:hypothetical protein
MFNLGGLLALTFIAVLILIFSPIFGDGKNGLQYSDDLFNKLSKGSSYFIPALSERAQKFSGTQFDVLLHMEKPDLVENAVKVLIVSGAQVGVTGTDLRVSGDLGRVLDNVLRDADAMFQNQGAKVSSLYAMNERTAMEIWWNVLSKTVKELQKAKKIEEASIVSDVVRKGIEPSYNFYGIEAQRVTDKAATMTALLVFYVLYTMWWGYAIFYMFDGIGLSMKKAKVKKEV